MRGKPGAPGKRLIISTPIFLGRGAKGDKDYEYRWKKDMEGSRVILPFATTLDSQITGYTATLLHYVAPWETSPIDGSITATLQRFIWRYNLTSSAGGLGRVAGDTVLFAPRDIPFTRGPTVEGVRLTPPALSDFTTVDWGVGSSFVMRRHNSTVRSGTRPVLYPGGNPLVDWRAESGSIPPGPFVGTWIATHAW